MPDQDNPIQPDIESVPTVECEPHSVEETGEASGDKLDTLLRTAITVRKELHERFRKALIGLLIAGFCLAAVGGAAAAALWGLKQQAADLQAIARENRENGKITRENGNILLEATGPEARARSAATLAKAINDIGRTGVCAAFYAVDEYHPACEDVTRTMDRIRAGENPYVP